MSESLYARILFDDDSVRHYNQRHYVEGGSELAFSNLIARMLLFGRNNYFDKIESETEEIGVIGPKPVAYVYWIADSQESSPKVPEGVLWCGIDLDDYRSQMDHFAKRKTG